MMNEADYRRASALLDLDVLEDDVYDAARAYVARKCQCVDDERLMLEALGLL